MIQIKDLVKGNTAKFVQCFDGCLWYEINGTGFRFPVPFEDTVGAVFNSEHKAINLMRWIRIHLESLEKERLEQNKQ